MSLLSPSTIALAPYADQYGAMYDVPPSLILADIQQESSGGANGTTNVMQVNGMNGSSVIQSIKTGAKMLGQYLSQTGGSVSESLAAYNMGSGILSYFNSHGGYSVANMQAFSDLEKAQNGYSVYGDPNYVQHVLQYLPDASLYTSNAGYSLNTSTSPTASNSNNDPYLPFFQNIQNSLTLSPYDYYASSPINPLQQPMAYLIGGSASSTAVQNNGATNGQVAGNVSKIALRATIIFIGFLLVIFALISMVLNSRTVQTTAGIMRGSEPTDE